jgi:hypothetical protein
MSQAGMSQLITQLGYNAPALFVYLIAFILALVFMGRAAIPCILTLVGVGILVLTTLGLAVVQAWLIDTRPTQFVRLMQIIGIAGSVLRAVGLGVLVAAIFVGRGSAVKGWAEP